MGEKTREDGTVPLTLELDEGSASSCPRSQRDEADGASQNDDDLAEGMLDFVHLRQRSGASDQVPAIRCQRSGASDQVVVTTRRNKKSAEF
ncbi:hypothetical protein Q31b_50010 [Novipirellula aureliae]|uniref:Uncharacterized protein n=1 Tax=Novipirellula aureliae TaxID=2527966 RepID=A0A5C6DPI7_9BACT|nr:hypothetical protein [Novipirellula aureliae]TWU36719.1 hypothetical protein Q31b_50010 [Novipirellula aureliae]